MSPGRAERHGFEYYRHGTLSLYAALDVKSGKVHGKTAAHHTSDEFVSFLEHVVKQCRSQQEIHIILDNLSAHKTKKVEAFLPEHPNVNSVGVKWLLLLAGSSRNLVRPHRTRGHRQRNLYLRAGSGPQAHALRPRICEIR